MSPPELDPSPDVEPSLVEPGAAVVESSEGDVVAGDVVSLVATAESDPSEVAGVDVVGPALVPVAAVVVESSPDASSPSQPAAKPPT